MSTAAIIIIGNEILTGKFADENAPYLIGRFREIGVDVVRVVVIPDVIETIGDEVRRASAACDYVLTTGGVGPTHDDLTMAGVAAGLGVPVVRHPVLAELIATKMRERAARGEESDDPTHLEAALRMADVPEGVDLWWDGPVKFPLVVARNVLIFPGVPALLRMKFEAVARRFEGVPVTTARLWTLRGEPAIADALTEAQARWPSVAIGSYPRFELSPPRVLVTLEGRDRAALAACEAWLQAAFPVCPPP